MAYNSNKGNQHSGDIQYENDPNDTQIDFENDFVALKTNGNQAFVVSGSLVGIGTAAPGAHPSGKNETSRATAEQQLLRALEVLEQSDLPMPRTLTMAKVG